MSDGTNQPTISWITRTLCVLAFIFGAAICALAYLERGIPPELNTVAGIVIGGLLSMLTKTTPTPAAPSETKLVGENNKPISEENRLPTEAL